MNELPRLFVLATALQNLYDASNDPNSTLSVVIKTFKKLFYPAKEAQKSYTLVASGVGNYSEISVSFSLPSQNNLENLKSLIDSICNSLITSTSEEQPDLTKQTQIEVSDEFYDVAEPVLNFADNSLEDILSDHSIKIIKKAQKRPKKISKEDYRWLIDLLISLISLILTLYLPMSLDQEATTLIQENISISEEILETTQRIADLEEQRIDLAKQEIALLQSISDSLQSLIDSSKAPEEGIDSSVEYEEHPSEDHNSN